jgi:hypothetical protein
MNRPTKGRSGEVPGNHDGVPSPAPNSGILRAPRPWRAGGGQRRPCPYRVAGVWHGRSRVQHFDGTWDGDQAPEQIVLWQVLDLEPLRAHIRNTVERGRMPEDEGRIVRRRRVMGSKPVFDRRSPRSPVRRYVRPAVQGRDRGLAFLAEGTGSGSKTRGDAAEWGPPGPDVHGGRRAAAATTVCALAHGRRGEGMARVAGVPRRPWAGVRWLAERHPARRRR